MVMSVITFIAGLIIGGVGIYFILKNNPKWVNLADIPKLSKEKLSGLLAKIDAELKK